jgi:branched-chain amino acid transport system permease protein
MRLPARPPRSLGWILVIVALVLWLPSLLGSDWDSIGTNTAIFAMIAVGLDLVWGLAGQASLGQQGFMLVGAYLVAIATTKWEISTLLTYPLAAAGTALVAAIVGLVVLRLHRTYLSLATLGLGLMLPTLVSAWDYTGRSGGIYGIAPIPGDLDRTQTYRLLWLATLVVVVFGLRIRSSTTGMSWRVIAENEDLARSCGVNTVAEKLKAFSIGAAIAGLAGAAYATNLSTITPTVFSLEVLLIVLVGVVVGGLGSVAGAVIGVIVLSIVQLQAAEHAEWTNFIFAAVFVLALRLLPRGIIPTVEQLGRRLWSRATSAAGRRTVPEGG